MTVEQLNDDPAPEVTEEQRVAADLYYNALKNSNELQAREVHRAHMAELNGYYW